MNLETFHQRVKSRILSAAQTSIPSLKAGSVFWQGEPAPGISQTVEVELDLVSFVAEDTRQYSPEDDDGLNRESSLVLAQVQVQVRSPNLSRAPFAHETAMRIWQHLKALAPFELNRTLELAVLSPGKIQTVKTVIDGRVQLVNFFTVPVRFEYSLPPESPATGTADVITSVVTEDTITADGDPSEEE